MSHTFCLTAKSIVAIFFACLMITSARADANNIILQSTTSTQNSGLFDFILPKFKEQTGISVNVVAVGTGQALKNGRNGDGDVLLVHAKSAEEKFVAEGYGVKRFDVMYNDFVIVGPDSDPAKISGSKGIVTALKKISDSKSAFLSRGDDSGTNKKELQLWAKTGQDPLKHSGNWYRETGSGMGATLNIAAGMNAYTLTDRATWLAFQNKQTLKILNEGDPLLFNQYGVMLVNPVKHPHVKANSGRAFINWLTGKQGQSAIAAYKLNGTQLFFPNAKK
ncbi:Tungstate ABC transporter, substrate-binding protein [hydrothermal vent metagenome]|uniref:Tungstate ABC transporter, substrate-binding protein n=1 Tax=hydrothermal vent metagenome TaxID=652676 RepID=A0A3B0RS41_9ZZZZ